MSEDTFLLESAIKWKNIEQFFYNWICDGFEDQTIIENSMRDFSSPVCWTLSIIEKS